LYIKLDLSLKNVVKGGKDFQEGYLNNYGYKIQKGDGIIGYHYANNQLDLYGIVEKFCRLPAEQQNEMPKLKELLRELTPVAHAVFRPYMRFATSDLGLDEAYDDRGDGFDPYRPVPNSAGGFDITEKMNISEEEKEREAKETGTTCRKRHNE